MTHLRIEQNNILENVSSAVIAKLYELATSGDLDASSHLAGNLYVPATYLEYIDVLTDLTNPKFKDLTITTGKIYLLFRDPEVFRVLMATGHIGDGIGITQSDCANYGDYTMYGDPYTIFRNNTTIEYFPELRYFTYWSNHTNLSSSTFNGCSNLKNIDITGWTSIPTAFVSGCPLSEFNILSLSGITYIGLFGFLNSGISGELSLPNLTNTDTNIFYGCTGLTKILSLGNITNVLSNSFYGCSNLTQVTLPTTCTSISSSAFLGCTNLSTLSGLSNVTTLNESCFRNCSSLTSIDIDLSNLTSVESNVFNGCTSLGTGLTLELNLTNLTSYPHNALRGTAFTRLILHSPLLSSNYDKRYPIYEDMRQLTYLDLSDWRPAKNSFNTSLYTDCQFYNNTSLVTYIAPITTNYIGLAINDMERYANARYFILLNTTPPSLNTTDRNNPPNEWFYNRNGNVHIYVPDSAVSAYLNDSAWSTIGGYNGSDTISDRLHGLSELPAGVWTTGLASQYLTAALLATS